MTQKAASVLKRVKVDHAHGAQVGRGNTQHNTYLPPQHASAAHASDNGQTVTITTGDGSTVSNTHKQTHLKFNIPVIAPLLSSAALHPVIAGVTAVAVVGGAGVVGTTVLSGQSDTTAITRGFPMRAMSSAGQPIGYDFSKTTPVVAGPNDDAIYNEGVELMSTSNEIAPWGGQKVPTGADCLAAVKDHATRTVSAYPQSLICYVDRNGKPGYILVTNYQSQLLTVDTAHLK